MKGVKPKTPIHGGDLRFPLSRDGDGIYLIALWEFAKGASAARVSKELNLSLKTISDFYRHVRARIAEDATPLSGGFRGEVQVDTINFGARDGRLRSAWYRHHAARPILIGFMDSEGLVRISTIMDRSKQEVLAAVASHVPMGTPLITNRLRVFGCLRMAGFPQVNQIELHGHPRGLRPAHCARHIASFWAECRAVLGQRRGVRGTTFFHHIKEIELRWNFSGKTQAALYRHLVRLLHRGAVGSDGK